MDVNEFKSSGEALGFIAAFNARVSPESQDRAAREIVAKKIVPKRSVIAMLSSIASSRSVFIGVSLHAFFVEISAPLETLIVLPNNIK